MPGKNGCKHCGKPYTDTKTHLCPTCLEDGTDACYANHGNVCVKCEDPGVYAEGRCEGCYNTTVVAGRQSEKVSETLANAALAFAVNVGPIGDALNGDLQAKLRVGKLLEAALKMQGLKVVRRDDGLLR